MAGFCYFSPSIYTNVYRFVGDPVAFDVNSTHNFVTVPLSAKVGDRFIFSASLSPTDSDNINFVVNINGFQLITFYTFPITIGYPCTFSFEIEILSATVMNYTATLGRSQTAPEISSASVTGIGDCLNFDLIFSIYSDSNPVGDIYYMAIDKIS